MGILPLYDVWRISGNYVNAFTQWGNDCAVNGYSCAYTLLEEVDMEG